MTKIVQETPIWSLLSLSLVQNSLLRFIQLSNVYKNEGAQESAKNYDKEPHIRSLLWSSKFGILDHLKIPSITLVELRKTLSSKEKPWLKSLHDNRKSHRRSSFRWRQKPVFYRAGKLCINFVKGRRTVCMTSLSGNPRTDLLGTEWDYCAIVWYAWNHYLMGGWTLTDNSLMENWMAVHLLHKHFFSASCCANMTFRCTSW